MSQFQTLNVLSAEREASREPFGDIISDLTGCEWPSELVLVDIEPSHSLNFPKLDPEASREQSGENTTEDTAPVSLNNVAMWPPVAPFQIVTVWLLEPDASRELF